MDKYDFLTGLGLYALLLSAFVLAAAVALVIYTGVGAVIVYALSLIGVVEFSWSVSTGVGLLVMAGYILYNAFVGGEPVISMEYNSKIG